MNIQELKKHTNRFGANFLNFIPSHWDILGVTDKGARKGEYFVIYRHDNKVGVFVLPCYSSPDNSTCFFGDIRHFSLYIQSLQPINKGKKHPFLYDIRTERNVNTWLKESFNVPSNLL